MKTFEEIVKENTPTKYKHPLIENGVDAATSKPLAKKHKGRFFIVFIPDYPYNGGYRIAQWSGKVFWSEDGTILKPTHWQKIPIRMNQFLPNLKRTHR